MSFLPSTLAERKSQKLKINKMKKLTLFTALILFFTGQTLAQQTVGKKDTVIINLGHNSRIILLVGADDDLELIKRYDINAMISDLTHQIDNLHEDEEITITDESGEKYLKKEEPVVEEKSDFQENDSEENQSYDEDNDRDNRDNDVHERSRRRHYWPRTRQSINIDLGLSNYLENFKFPDQSNAPYSLNQQGSCYIGINTTYKTNLAGPLFMEWGGGFDWYMFKLDKNNIRYVKTDSLVRFDPDPRTNINPIRSKLNTGYIYVKLVPMLDFSYNARSRLWNYHGDGFRIGVGGYSALRIASQTKFVYKDNGDKQKDKDSSNIYLNNFRYGLRFQIGFRGIDLFANYDVSPLFSKNRGPELNTFSFGFTL